jgi:hypothetical protein
MTGRMQITNPFRLFRLPCRALKWSGNRRLREQIMKTTTGLSLGMTVAGTRVKNREMGMWILRSKMRRSY